MSRRTGAVLAALLGLALVAGCGGSDTSTPAPSTGSSSGPSTTALRYVALGDSYTAAPYVRLTDLAGGCLRSDHNYPHVLARTLGTPVTDVSCSGAQTKDLVAPQTTFGDQQQPAQLAAVSADTDLVTIGMGGNDQGLFATLVSQCPLTGPPGLPGSTGGTVSVPSGACGHFDLADARAKIAKVRTALTTSLREITAKAPDAQVVLVGYPRLLDPGRTCAAFPVARADLPRLVEATRLLATAMRGAATDAGVDFVDLYGPSAGHGICAGRKAWVNGVRTNTRRAAAVHPFAVEQEVVARLVAAKVEARGQG